MYSHMQYAVSVISPLCTLYPLHRRLSGVVLRLRLSTVYCGSLCMAGFTSSTDKDEKVPVHVEACLKAVSAAPVQSIRDAVVELLENQSAVYSEGAIDFSDDDFLSTHLLSLSITDLEESSRVTELCQAELLSVGVVCWLPVVVASM